MSPLCSVGFAEEVPCFVAAAGVDTLSESQAPLLEPMAGISTMIITSTTALLLLMQRIANAFGSYLVSPPLVELTALQCKAIMEMPAV